MLVYVWSRRNPFIRMNFFGLLNFLAPYLPWVLLGFSVILGNTIWVDLMGMAVGHIYYFLEDVFPKQRGGMRILKTPLFLYVHFWFDVTVTFVPERKKRAKFLSLAERNYLTNTWTIQITYRFPKNVNVLVASIGAVMDWTHSSQIRDQINHNHLNSRHQINKIVNSLPMK